MAQYVYTMNNVAKLVPPKRHILRDISLSFFPGAKIGVLGLNGAGKSTLLRIMGGVDTEFEGEARPQPGIKIGYLPQEPELDPAKDVRGNVEEGVADTLEIVNKFNAISERFAEAIGKSSRLSSLGWRVGGTIGLGITTALNNGGSDNGSAPVSTLSAGVRYEFPLGRPSREVVETGDSRLDQRTRVGIECGLQGGFSTRESLRDRTDLGMYFGILVNTPWGG